LGHYFGALQNWLKLQQEYECFFFVADWHALTTHYEDTSSVAENTLQVAMDWLAVGLDPAKSTLFIQSSVLEHAELNLLLGMITPLSWLERVPTYKEQIENLKDRDLGTFGFLGYPLLQSADIVLYGGPGRELLVPVGEDQVPHVELTREITRKFNFNFGITVDINAMERDQSGSQTDRQGFFLIKHGLDVIEGLTSANASVFGPSVPQENVHDLARRIRHVAFAIGFANLKEEFAKSVPAQFKRFVREHGIFRKYVHFDSLLSEPAPLLTETPRLPGLDGRRMAKSYGNAIWLSDPPDEIRAKVRNMMTDPQRQRRTDPGRPEICPVFAWHKLFSPSETVASVDRDCRTAAIGCVDCKKMMAENLVTWIEPVQARRKEFEAHPRQVWDILDAGGKKAQKAAKKTMKRVRNAIFKWDDARKERAFGEPNTPTSG
jgi:tryptophanyl-tRNA synthetase